MIRLLLIAGLAASLPLHAQQPSARTDTLAQITVTAKGEASTKPDRARITVGVHTRAATVALAATENARRQRAVIDALRALGIGPDQIATSSISVYPEQSTNANDETPRIVGYSVTNTVRVDVWKVEQVGSVIDAALAKGANELNALEFYPSAADSLTRAALADAVIRARAEAQSMASAAGAKLGDLIELSSTESVPGPVPMLAMARVASEQTPVVPGLQSITVTIVARWRLIIGRK